MKKKLLFVIPSLDAGGAEKSLVNLLNTLDPKRFSVDVFLFTKRGLFLTQVPEFVRIITPGADMVTFQKPVLRSMLTFLGEGKVKMAWNRLRFAQINRLHRNRTVAEQRSWPYLRSSVGLLPGSYDAAIGYLEKSSVYFTVDCVRSKIKMGLIHTFYSKLDADKSIDSQYFNALAKLITVSAECASDLAANFPEFSSKMIVIHNIVSVQLIRSMSVYQVEDIGPNPIVSIGRLVELKGFDLAIEAAKILKDRGVKFQWSIIGEGPERDRLQALITQYELDDYVYLPGLKENPYPYIRQASLLVQPSRYEGKSIVIDEAKILAKPILLTDFSTAKDQIDNEVDGLIVEMNAEAIATGVQRFLEDEKFRHEVAAQLADGNFGTEEEIEKFYSLI